MIRVIVLQTGFTDFKFRLPSSCQNKTSVYVRWVQNGTVSVNGGAIGTNSSANASIKGVSIQAELFSAPTSQSSNISIVSVTPTTITIACTPGSGDKRILKINTTNSFTNPVNDENPVANATYGGSGEQVVFNGTGTKIVINVPSSTNQYYLRYYDYNTIDNLTRYNTNEASGNPKLCALENIHSPVYSQVRLTTAVLGATIEDPSRLEIADRGVFWSYTSGVDETSDILSKGGVPSAGTYSLPITGLDRGTTVYFKGYVTNESGTILTEESSFSNVPIFTGEGRWETAARWNVQEVPGEANAPLGSLEDSPIIDGICTIYSSVTECNNLTINSGKKLIIDPSQGLTVNGTLTNDGTFTIESPTNNGAAGSLITPGDIVNNGSMVFKRWISQASLAANDYNWHTMSLPVGDCLSQKSFLWDYLYIYNEPNNGWSNVIFDDMVYAGKGYIVKSKINGDKKVIFEGTFNTGDFTYNLNNTGSDAAHGYNMIGNPYPSYLDFEAIGRTNVGSTFYVWDPDSQNYIFYQIGGIGTLGQYLHPTQGFIAKVTTGNATGTINLENADRTHTQASIGFRAAQASPKVILKVANKENTVRNDVLYIQQTSNSNDGYKIFSMNTETPQLYAKKDNQVYAIYNAAEFSEGSSLPVSFKSSISGQYTINVTDLSLTSTEVYLKDNLGETILLEEGASYTFAHDASNTEDRFTLLFGTQGATGVNGNVSSNITATNQANGIQLNHAGLSAFEYNVSDISGRLIYAGKASENSTIIPIISKGVYLISSSLPQGVITVKVIR